MLSYTCAHFLLCKVETTTGQLTNFIVEPFLPHPSHTEYYVCINSGREGDSILFTHEGGIDVGDVDAKALKLDILVGADFPSRQTIKDMLLKNVPPVKKDTLVDFLVRLYSVYVDLHFAYLEINPLICLDGENGIPPTIHYLDMAAKLDQVRICPLLSLLLCACLLFIDRRFTLWTKMGYCARFEYL